jgi:hypothetical protein
MVSGQVRVSVVGGAQGLGVPRDIVHQRQWDGVAFEDQLSQETSRESVFCEGQ